MGKKITQLPVLPTGYALNDDTLLAVVVGDGSEELPFKTIKITLAQLRTIVGGGGGGGPTFPKLIDLGLVTQVWEADLVAPVYSSPIGPVYLHTTGAPGMTRPCILVCSFDGNLNALHVEDGSIGWSRGATGPCYGRPQAGDVLGTGLNVSYFPSHDGKIRSVAYDNVVRWAFENAYDREGTGTVTAAGTYYIEDSTKSWAINAFMRQTAAPYTENATVEILTGTGAGQTRTISQNNEGTRLWVTDAWTTIPDATSTYRINKKYESDNIFMHAGTLVNESGTWYLYATCFDNHCYKINADTGDLVWKFATLENIEPYPLVYGDGCFIVSIDGKTRKLDRTTGTLTWESITGQCDAFLSITNISGTDVVTVSSRDNSVHKLDISDGSSLGVSDATGGDIDSGATTFSVEGLKLIAAGSDDGKLYCFNGDDMTTSWVFDGQSDGINSSPLFHDVLGDGSICVLVANMAGTLFCVKGNTGEIVGVIEHADGIEGVPLYADIDADGAMELVVTTVGGKVVCYRFANGGQFAPVEYPGLSRWAGYQTG